MSLLRQASSLASLALALKLKIAETAKASVRMVYTFRLIVMTE
jgi:hypothetical protein